MINHSLPYDHDDQWNQCCDPDDCQNSTQPEVPDQPDLPRTWKLQLHPIHGDHLMWSSFQNQSQLPSNLMKKLLIKLLAGLLPRARDAFARPAGQQTHSAQLGKVLYFFLAFDETNRPAD